MVGITGLPSADQTGAPGDEFDVLPITNPPRHRQRESGLIDRLGSPPPVGLFWIVAMRWWKLLRRLRGVEQGFFRGGSQAGQLCSERLLDECGISCRQFVFFGQAPVRPVCRIIGGAEGVEFGKQAFA